MAPATESASKRKRPTFTGGEPPSKRRIRSESASESASESNADEGSGEILLLETQIFESKKNYNNIAQLIQIVQNREDDAEQALVAAVSLCRVFIRLLGMGDFEKTKEATKKQIAIVRQLREWLSDFSTSLLPMLQQDETALTALTLSMRVWKAAADRLPDTDTFPWELFKKLVKGLLNAEVDGGVREEFIEKFMGPHDDVRFYTYRAIQYVSSLTFHRVFSVLTSRTYRQVYTPRQRCGCK